MLAWAERIRLDPGTLPLRSPSGALGQHRPRTIDVVCQAWGSDVGGNRLWDRLTGGQWVSDYLLNTPGYNTLSPPNRWC